MSGQFVNDGSQRITEQETLIIRQELIQLLNINEQDSLWVKNDYYNHKNLLLPNPIKEKEDNGDIDIFLFYDDKEINKVKYYLDLLEWNKNVLKINKNDKTYSCLYYSEKVNKKVQIDLHIIWNTLNNITNYFEYYRVPYLYFILGMIFNKVNVKYSIEWVSYLIESKIEEQSNNVLKEYVKIEKNCFNFLEKILNISFDEIKYIDSFKKISDLLIKHELHIYDFWKKEENIRGDYLKKIKNNDKLRGILKMLPESIKTIEEFKDIFNKRLSEIYPFLPQVEKRIRNEFIKAKEENDQRRKDLVSLFWKELKDLDIKQKRMIPLFSSVLKELLILKEVAKEVKDKTNKDIYLVWWAVRDILLGQGNKDWDICWSLHPNEFKSLFGGEVTEKYWTVFCNIKNLEIEYTPFRIENGLNWRHIEEVVFSDKIEEDALRRDFTVNALYLNLNTLEIDDFYDGISDLTNKTIKAVENPEERFKEDYLRILRWIRLASKLWFKIEEKTYNSMINNFKFVKKLSVERILEELLKGLNLKNNKGWNYLNLLDKIGKESKEYLEIRETYEKFEKNIYFLIGYFVNFDIEDSKKIKWNFKGDSFNLYLTILKWYESLLKKGFNLDTKEKKLQYLINLKIKPKFYNYYLDSLLRLNELNKVKNNKEDKKFVENIGDLKETIKEFHLIRVTYDYKKILAELNIDSIVQFQKENNLIGNEKDTNLTILNKYLEKKYKKLIVFNI